MLTSGLTMQVQTNPILCASSTLKPVQTSAMPTAAEFDALAQARFQHLPGTD